MNLHLVFVYGSLKRGQRHHGELAGARFVGQARAVGARLVHYVDGYPALVQTGTEAASRALASDDENVPNEVPGELYEVDGALLGRLDDFEDCPVLYRRALIEVVLVDDAGVAATVVAHAYVIEAGLGAAYPPIEGGWSHG